MKVLINTINIKYIYISILILVFPLLSFSQKVSNIHFEQVGKQIYIYYDLEGNDTYTVQVFCSTNNGQSWGQSLKYVTGDVGEGQKQGNGKVIVWDVLSEREKLSGEILFRIEVVNVGIFTDNRDGQTYKWVKIGNQFWMAENIAYNANRGCWAYDKTQSNVAKYGYLYDWKTAKIACPGGWHLPSDEEWKVLEMNLGMSQGEVNLSGYRGTYEGKKLKSTCDWYGGGLKGTDRVGFSGSPGGYYDSAENYFAHLDFFGYWWSSTANASTQAWYRVLSHSHHGIDRSNDSKVYGYSIRCVKD